MPRICYVPKDFRDGTLDVIDAAAGICSSYAEKGYDLTLRQLFYQFVSRDLLPNTERSYNRLGSIVNDARLAGLIDWTHVVDRTRVPKTQSHWDDPAEIVRSAARSFAMDKWERQKTRVEVWIEKDALVGVLAACCPADDVTYFSCRGYTSQSAIWRAAQRLAGYIRSGQNVVVIHLGDHDPSGIDMTRDIEQRLAMFIAIDVYDAPAGEEPEAYMEYLDDGGDQRLEIERIALNMDQVRRYNPPPNPAKLTDSRATSYIAKHGRHSWELDALEPTVLVDMIQRTVDAHRDGDQWSDAVREQEAEREILTAASDRWDDVKEFLL